MYTFKKKSPKTLTLNPFRHAYHIRSVLNDDPIVDGEEREGGQIGACDGGVGGQETSEES